MNWRPEDIAAQMLKVSEQLARGARTIPGLEAHASLYATSHEQVFVLERMRLLRFTSEVPRPGLPPLLLVYALVNRPYMLDLEPDRSFIRGLLAAGRDVYLVDWGDPQAADRELGLDDYAHRYIDACVDFLCTEHHAQAVDLLGVCQGGTFSLCYAAMQPDRVNRLVTLVTPVDFHAPGFLLARWLKYVDVGRLVETFGNVPGALLNRAFLALKPLSLTTGKAVELLDLMDRPDALASFARMEQWLHDSPDQAGRAFLEFTRVFIRGNALVDGGLRVAGREVTLASVRSPVLNVHARRDHIVPPAASSALGPLIVGAPYTDLAFDGGHVGIFASRRSQALVPTRVARWLEDPASARR